MLRQFFSSLREFFHLSRSSEATEAVPQERSLFSKFSSEPQYIVLRPDGVKDALYKSGLCMKDEIAARMHYWDFVQGKGSLDIDKLINDAVLKGKGVTYIHHSKNAWLCDPYCQSKFQEALRPLGFSAVFRLHESDGPEADRLSLTIEPLRFIP